MARSKVIFKWLGQMSKVILKYWVKGHFKMAKLKDKLGQRSFKMARSKFI